MQAHLKGAQCNRTSQSFQKSQQVASKKVILKNALRSTKTKVINGQQEGQRTNDIETDTDE